MSIAQPSKPELHDVARAFTGETGPSIALCWIVAECVRIES